MLYITSLLGFLAYSGFCSAAITQGPQTLIFKEVNGVPGNECLTFRNNGEIVDAACVADAADRQITPSTDSTTGQSVLFIQRTFSASFCPDLVGKELCIGFNGTDFLAQDCADPNIQFVSFDGTSLVSGSACDSGHDAKAQLMVDVVGQTCASFTTTQV